MSSLASRPSTPGDTTTQASLSEATTHTKRSWVWLYFGDADEGYVECNAIDPTGKSCKKRLKRDRTGSTKSMSDHLFALHRLSNPNTKNIPNSNMSLDIFVMCSKSNKILTCKSLKTALIYFISECDLPLSLTD
ncbi:hypothetical protein O181_127946 [Austropuccinia psidii MF-1]|uniref:BED-type domain-containing protein n=1 Tax=Austropuccinia psidii MF-1 TaxID=1389203 RepID=A0A9Q3Q786_9BASI|nr:hypothetical protein [Austropuccinia psidii MF-1]